MASLCHVNMVEKQVYTDWIIITNGSEAMKKLQLSFIGFLQFLQLRNCIWLWCRRSNLILTHRCLWHQPCSACITVCLRWESSSPPQSKVASWCHTKDSCRCLASHRWYKKKRVCRCYEYEYIYCFVICWCVTHSATRFNHHSPLTRISTEILKRQVFASLLSASRIKVYLICMTDQCNCCLLV